MENREALRIGITGVLALAAAHAGHLSREASTKRPVHSAVISEQYAVIPEPSKLTLPRGFLQKL